MRKKKEVGETFHTFLKSVVMINNNIEYQIYGYRAIDGEVVSFSATIDKNTPWTKSTVYSDKILIDLFVEKLNSRI